MDRDCKSRLTHHVKNATNNYELSGVTYPDELGMLAMCRWGCWSGFAIPIDTETTFEMKEDF